jgi:hypothetical protein
MSNPVLHLQEYRERIILIFQVSRFLMNLLKWKIFKALWEFLWNRNTGHIKHVQKVLQRQTNRDVKS